MDSQQIKYLKISFCGVESIKAKEKYINLDNVEEVVRGLKKD